MLRDINNLFMGVKLSLSTATGEYQVLGIFTVSNERYIYEHKKYLMIN